MQRRLLTVGSPKGGGRMSLYEKLSILIAVLTLCATVYFNAIR